jgi:hypothetical protein
MFLAGGCYFACEADEHAVLEVATAAAEADGSSLVRVPIEPCFDCGLTTPMPPERAEPVNVLVGADPVVGRSRWWPDHAGGPITLVARSRWWPDRAGGSCGRCRLRAAEERQRGRDVRSARRRRPVAPEPIRLEDR